MKEILETKKRFDGREWKITENLNLIIAKQKKMFWLKIIFLKKIASKFVSILSVTNIYATWVGFEKLDPEKKGEWKKRRGGERKEIFVGESQPDIWDNVTKRN